MIDQKNHMYPATTFHHHPENEVDFELLWRRQQLFKWHGFLLHRYCYRGYLLFCWKQTYIYLQGTNLPQTIRNESFLFFLPCFPCNFLSRSKKMLLCFSTSNQRSNTQVLQCVLLTCVRTHFGTHTSSHVSNKFVLCSIDFQHAIKRAIEHTLKHTQVLVSSGICFFCILALYQVTVRLFCVLAISTAIWVYWAYTKQI